MQNPFQVDGRIWLNCKNTSFIGQGKIELILKIKELGSLRKAAIEMKMSYRQAWYHINSINKSALTPLVILKRGGKDGGVAEITAYGEKIIVTFLNLQHDFDEFLKEQTLKLNA